MDKSPEFWANGLEFIRVAMADLYKDEPTLGASKTNVLELIGHCVYRQNQAEKKEVEAQERMEIQRRRRGE